MLSLRGLALSAVVGRAENELAARYFVLRWSAVAGVWHLAAFAVGLPTVELGLLLVWDRSQTDEDDSVGLSCSLSICPCEKCSL